MDLRDRLQNGTGCATWEQLLKDEVADTDTARLIISTLCEQFGMEGVMFSREDVAYAAAAHFDSQSEDQTMAYAYAIPIIDAIMDNSPGSGMTWGLLGERLGETGEGFIANMVNDAIAEFDADTTTIYVALRVEGNNQPVWRVSPFAGMAEAHAWAVKQIGEPIKGALTTLYSPSSMDMIDLRACLSCAHDAPITGFTLEFVDAGFDLLAALTPSRLGPPVSLQRQTPTTTLLSEKDQR